MLLFAAFSLSVSTYIAAPKKDPKAKQASMKQAVEAQPKQISEQEIMENFTVLVDYFKSSTGIDLIEDVGQQVATLLAQSLNNANKNGMNKNYSFDKKIVAMFYSPFQLALLPMYQDGANGEKEELVNGMSVSLKLFAQLSSDLIDNMFFLYLEYKEAGELDRANKILAAAFTRLNMLMLSISSIMGESAEQQNQAVNA